MDNSEQLKSGSGEPIKVEVVNTEDLPAYLIKVALGAAAVLLIKKGGEILLDDLNERRKARKAARKERRLQVVKDEK